MFWAGDGCPGGKPNTDGEYKPKSETAGVRCCKVVNDKLRCDTVDKCPGTATFDQAVCSCMGHMDDEDSSIVYDRLCTEQELKTIVNGKEVCCGTGGQCNDYLVWSLYRTLFPVTTCLNERTCDMAALALRRIPRQ